MPPSAIQTGWSYLRPDDVHKAEPHARPDDSCNLELNSKPDRVTSQPVQARALVPRTHERADVFALLSTPHHSQRTQAHTPVTPQARNSLDKSDGGPSSASGSVGRSNRMYIQTLA
jgi:hypothetical protein